ncbi:Uncharacterized protein QTN25_004909 [Entamoeba marina]
MDHENIILELPDGVTADQEFTFVNDHPDHLILQIGKDFYTATMYDTPTTDLIFSSNGVIRNASSKRYRCNKIDVDSLRESHEDSQPIDLSEMSEMPQETGE